MYVAGEDALDQFFCRHPDEFLDRPVERAILDHESEEIHLAHLERGRLRAAADARGRRRVRPALGGSTPQRLVKQGRLRERGGRYLPRGEGYPAGRIALRSASPDSVAVVEADGGELIGIGRDRARALRRSTRARSTCTWAAPTRSRTSTCAAGARSCSRSQGDWYTQPKKETETCIEEVRERREACGVELSFGIVSVTEQVVAYQKKRVADHVVLDLLALDLPEQQFVTQALWYELPDALLRDEFPLDVLPGLAARRRARPDRGAAADRDVRPLGHRRALDRLPPPDGRGRRSSSTTATRAAWGSRASAYERFEALVGRRAAADLRVPLPVGLPVVRAVAEVRQPERAAQQERRDRDALAHGRGLTSRLAGSVAAGRNSFPESKGGPQHPDAMVTVRLRLTLLACVAALALAAAPPSAAGGASEAVERSRLRANSIAAPSGGTAVGHARSSAGRAGARRREAPARPAPSRCRPPALRRRRRVRPPLPGQRAALASAAADARFGARRKGHRHQGQDIVAAEGTPVVAPWAGLVEFVRFQKSGAGLVHRARRRRRGSRLRLHAPAQGLDPGDARAST